MVSISYLDGCYLQSWVAGSSSASCGDPVSCLRASTVQQALSASKANKQFLDKKSRDIFLHIYIYMLCIYIYMYIYTVKYVYIYVDCIVVSIYTYGEIQLAKYARKRPNQKHNRHQQACSEVLHSSCLSVYRFKLHKSHTLPTISTQKNHLISYTSKKTFQHHHNPSFFKPKPYRDQPSTYFVTNFIGHQRG